MTTQAVTVLGEILSNGPVPVRDAVDAMAKAGFSPDQVKQAKVRLQVRSTKADRWQWSLPEATDG